MPGAAGLSLHRIAERDTRFEQRRQFMECHHLVLGAEPAPHQRRPRCAGLRHLDHGMALGTQLPDQVGDRGGLGDSLDHPTAAIDDLVLVLPHRGSLLEREAGHFFRSGATMGCLEQAVFQQGSMPLLQGQRLQLIEFRP